MLQQTIEQRIIQAITTGKRLAEAAAEAGEADVLTFGDAHLAGLIAKATGMASAWRDIHEALAEIRDRRAAQ